MATAQPDPDCACCGGSGVEEIYGGHGTVLELPCSLCRSVDQAGRIAGIQLEQAYPFGYRSEDSEP
jgi:hypothetical protein